MPGKKEKKKAGHFMSYFRHKLLNLKDAWKRKKKKITGHVLFLFFLKDAWKKKKRKRNRPLYVNTLFYHDLCCSLFQSVQLIQSLFHSGIRESFREGFWEWAMHITLCCETQGWDNLTMCIRTRVGCSRLFLFFWQGRVFYLWVN